MYSFTLHWTKCIFFYDWMIMMIINNDNCTDLVGGWGGNAYLLQNTRLIFLGYENNGQCIYIILSDQNFTGLF